MFRKKELNLVFFLKFSRGFFIQTHSSESSIEQNSKTEIEPLKVKQNLNLNVFVYSMCMNLNSLPAIQFFSSHSLLLGERQECTVVYFQ